MRGRTGHHCCRLAALGRKKRINTLLVYGACGEIVKLELFPSGSRPVIPIEFLSRGHMNPDASVQSQKRPRRELPAGELFVESRGLNRSRPCASIGAAFRHHRSDDFAFRLAVLSLLKRMR